MFQTINPPRFLREFVKYFWIMKNKDDQVIRIQSLSDCSTGIIVQHNNGKSSFVKDGERLPTAFVYGPYTIPSVTISDQAITLTGLVFKYQALPLLFKTSSCEFTDRMISLNEFSKKDVVNRVLDTAHPATWIETLVDFLMERVDLCKTHEPDSIIRSSIDIIHSLNTDSSNLTVDSLVKLSGLSKHQFERRFLTATGILPKFYLRVYRLRKAIELLEKGNFQNLTEVAYSMNYSDQSHFIKDIKNLTGSTPKQLSNLVSRYGRVEHFMIPQ
ncbi:helix-turn-helix domain-containing protein [Negadavirga shengliensis]|uniref:Helix-turn-helix domain-containing protein n=1 Tax=Negadavirga shengliensis TaxID=1389218 RepID=A0ABV9T7K3_9BACT